MEDKLTSVSAETATVFVTTGVLRDRVGVVTRLLGTVYEDLIRDVVLDVFRRDSHPFVDLA